MRNNGGDFQAQWFADPGYVPKGSAKSAYNAFSSSGGVLSIVAQPTPATLYSGDANLPYVSGQLTTAHKYTQRYGYFELRARLPRGSGLWSRFWLLTDDGVWPGEYDVFEVLGKETGQVHQTTHYMDATHPHVAEGFDYKGINPVDGQFHTYGLLWEKSGVTYYVDGVASPTLPNRVDIPMYVLVDLAVGNDPGNLWPGNPNASTSWPSTMAVDYLRVYSSDPSLPSVDPQPGYSPGALPAGLTVVTTPLVGPLPPGWTVGDIGNPDLHGSSTWNPVTGEWMVKGAGYGNQGQFAGTSLPGDGAVVASLQTVTRMNSNDVRAGVAMRLSRDVNAPEISLVHVTSFHSPASSTRVALISRGGGASTVELASVANIAAPVQLRLSRKGTLLVGSYSSDGGKSWSEVGRVDNAALSGTLQAGLVVAGNQDNYLRLSRATFNDVAVTAN